MEPKILVAVPYHKQKEYSLDHLLEVVDKMTYKNKDVVMRWDLEVYGGRDNVKKQREYFRNLVLKGDYDYLYFLGADTIPPVDVLERLLAHHKDIIGGVYWGRHGADNSTVEGSVAWIHDNHMLPEDKVAMFKSGNTLTIDGMGMDCVLISRRVLEQISWLSWEFNDDDYPFYNKAKELGFEICIDTKIQCRHYFDATGYSYMGERSNV